MSNGKEVNWPGLSRVQSSVDKRECNWDDALPSSITQSIEEESEFSDLVQRKENLAKLDQYVARMAYKPSEPPKPPKHLTRTESLARPRNLKYAYELYSDYYEPPERADRVKSLTISFRTISPEEFERLHGIEVKQQGKRDRIIKQKEKLFYKLSSKLEEQSRSQYLNALIHKFADFVADMATTMNIPPQLNEPYARMQRGIFYNIVCSLGIQPPTQAAYYYNTKDAIPYETIHKTAHAILCLIIKALDAAALKDPDLIAPPEGEPEMDTYIKERLNTAAKKKLRKKSHSLRTCLEKLNQKCRKFGDGDHCLDL